MKKYKVRNIPNIFNANLRSAFLTMIILLVFICLSTSELFSQEDENKEEIKVHNGGFGGSIVKYTLVKEQEGIILGYYGGWIIDHKYVIGAGGYSLFNRVKADNLPSFGHDETYYLKSSYGGLILEYIFYPDDFIRANYHILVGGGEVKYVNYDNYDFNYHGKSSYYIIEPDISFDINVIKNIKLSIGGGYHFVTGVNLDGVSNKDLSGFSASFTIKLGSF